MDPFLAEIRVFGFNFAPVGWATCDGQLLPISQNTALFSLLGTNFGGDGRSNFALPNLQNSFALGAGNGPGLSPRFLGEVDGSATVTLLSSEMPNHGHGLNASASASSTTPGAAAMAPTANGSAAYRTPGTLSAMASDSVGSVGNGAAHENRQPYLGLMFCIAMQGIFPSRN